jgi:hypothetical protein
LRSAFACRSGRSWQPALASGTAWTLGVGHDLIHFLDGDRALVLQRLQLVDVDLNPVLKIDDRRRERADRAPLNDIAWN